MRARSPDASGFVERGWRARVVGAVRRTASQRSCSSHAPPIVDSQMWKAQIAMVRPAPHSADVRPALATAAAIDPPTRAAYADDEFIADRLAVLDANDVAQAVVVAGCVRAPACPCLGRRLIPIASSPSSRSTPASSRPTARSPGSGGFDNEPVGDTGWEQENRHHWLRDWDRYTEFFFDELLPEAHSTKQHEDCVEWAAATTAET